MGRVVVGTMLCLVTQRQEHELFRMADQWGNLCRKMQEKRCKKCPEKGKTSRKFQGNQLTVQRLSSDVTGRAQKYSRIGPREFVPIDSSDEITMESIKRACETYFKPKVGSNLTCDILAGERPSCQSLDQVPDLKVIHIRFVGKGKYESIDESSASASDEESGSQCKSQRCPASRFCSPQAKDIPAKAPKLAEVREVKSSPSKFPLSLSISEMIKLGKLSTDTVAGTVVKLYTFDLHLMAWSQVPITVEFYEEGLDGKGGFRNAYKASSKHPEFRNETWVIKRYQAKATEGIEEIGLTLEEHTRKTVQMHMLAKNFALQLQQSIKKEDTEIFGELLTYRNIYFGETSSGEFVTVEEFIDGKFTKYINNNGLVCVGVSDVMCQKAECLTHFSYSKSEKKLMLLDVQGSGSNLFDPEIASVELYDDKNDVL